MEHFSTEILSQEIKNHSAATLASKTQAARPDRPFRIPVQRSETPRPPVQIAASLAKAIDRVPGARWFAELCRKLIKSRQFRHSLANLDLLASQIETMSEELSVLRDWHRRTTQKVGLINGKMSLDEFYFHFENAFRGSPERVKEKLQVYLPLVKQVRVDLKELPVIDLGCGRGEWLELLRENGIKSKGVDLNGHFVHENVQKGLDVAFADAIEFLQQIPSHSVAGVTGFHIVEHLQFQELLRLLNECRRVVVDRGFLLFETPNPENILVGSCDFYSDPTHRNPIPPQVLGFIVSQFGFPVFRIIRNSPPKRHLGAEEELSDDLRFIADRFNVARDYGVIASADEELPWK